MTPFDQAARYAARQLDAVGFLRWLLPQAFPSWHWDSWLDTQTLAFPGEVERRPDTVAVLDRQARDAPPVAVVIEFQSRPQADMLERLADYVLRIRRDLPLQRNPLVRYDVVGVVLNLTGSPQRDAWQMFPADLGGVGLEFRALVRTLARESASVLLQQIDQGVISRGVLPWVPLLEGGNSSASVEAWKRLAEQEPEGRRRSDYGGLALVFAELAGCAEAWRTGLEDWNVEGSQIVQEWQAKARAEGEASGRAEGEARGRAEGEARGRTEALRAKLLQVIRLHLKTEPPADMTAMVQTQIDPETLSQWFDQALVAGNRDELRKALGLA